METPPDTNTKLTVQEFFELTDRFPVKILAKCDNAKMARVLVGGRNLVVSYAALSMALQRPVVSEFVRAY